MEHVYARAHELCRQVGQTPQLPRVMRGLWAFYIQRAKFHDALDLGEQLLGFAQRAQDPARLIEAHFAIGVPLSHRGEFARAREQLDQGIALYDPHHHHSPRALQDFGVTCRSYGALTLWHLGYPDQALHRNNEALTLARDLSHPFSLAYALFFAVQLHQLRREGPATQERAEAAIALSTEQEFVHWATWATVYRGWALAVQGQTAEGRAQMRQGLSAWQGIGSVAAIVILLGLLAEACAKAGQPEEGLRALAEALAVVNNTGERWWEAELYRLKGQLTLQSRHVEDISENTNPQHPAPSTQAEAEAEVCFLKAIEVARQQSAKSWELRASTSLARLWQQQGKKTEARQMLAEIYGWFTEGFDTKDLQEATALLEELS